MFRRDQRKVQEEEEVLILKYIVDHIYHVMISFLGITHHPLQGDTDGNIGWDFFENFLIYFLNLNKTILRDSE